MTKLLIRPPDGTQSFTFNLGCGKPHEYDGEPIDCQKCADHVVTLSEDERIYHPGLRGPVPVRGDTDTEREAFAKTAAARRDAASWRLVAAQEKAPKAKEPEGDALAAYDDDRLRAELERRLRARAPAKRPAAKG